MEHSPINEIRIPDGGIETSLPGFPAYYETINNILHITKYVSLGILIILLIYTIMDFIKNKKINKKLIVINIVVFIIMVLASFIRMPYWS